MKCRRILFVALPLLFFAVLYTFAQDSSVPIIEKAELIYSENFFDIILSSGLLGVLTWTSIFLWAIALLPLRDLVYCSLFNSSI